MPTKSRLLQDIRYCESAELPDKWRGPPGSLGEIFLIPKEATSLAQRLGKRAAELGISIGYATHLYLCFTSKKSKETIILTDYTMAPWQRYASYSLRPSFNACSDEMKLSMLVDATLEVLARIGSPAVSSPANFKRDVLNESLLLLVKSKSTLKYNVTIYQTVPVHPLRTEVFAHIVQNKTGKRIEIKIGSADFYSDVPGMVDRISLAKEILTVLPRKALYLNQQFTPVNLEPLFELISK